jgi:hypothetical protein
MSVIVSESGNGTGIREDENKEMDVIVSESGNGTGILEGDPLI